MNHKKNVLTIAGSDSSGGAGIQADIKTFEALNTYSASVITSVTSQNSLGVQHVFDLPDGVVASQLESVLSDIKFSAVKIGMLKKRSYVEIVAQKLSNIPPINIILDPVMVSSSGHRLMDESAISSLTKHIFPIATLVTPNIPEAAALLEKDPEWVEANLKPSCKALIDKFSLSAVLLKGGHLAGDSCKDTLAISQKNLKPSNVNNSKSIQYSTHEYPKIKTRNTHGTGCTLSSAIAGYLAQGKSLETAVKLAGVYLQLTLKQADLQNVGSKTGPLNHHPLNMKDSHHS